jgi:ribonuclease Z
MTKVTFLGTSASTPTKNRALPALVVEYNGKLLLFDCGEGTQRQMMRYGINISRVDAVFLSHIHGDHTIGLAGLIRTLALNRRESPLDIYVPAGYERAISALIKFDGVLLGYKINVNPIRSGVICKGDGFEVRAFKLRHTVSTYGFVFKEEDKLHFIKDKIKGTGLKGVMFSELLSKGRLRVGGVLIELKDVTVLQRGVKIAYATDTRPSRETVEAARDADLLVHEATYASAERRLALERQHSTARESAHLAKSARAKRLVLTHMSARYKSLNKLLKEAREIFPNTDIAKDGMSIEL